MDAVFYSLVFICGGFLAIQGPMNAKLSANFGRHPISTVSLTFFLGSACLIALALVLQISLPSLSANTTAWWHWTGGLMGAGYVATISLSVPRLGTATTMVLVLLGQVIFSILLDQFGWFGMAEHPTTWPRLVGVLLVFLGAFLVRTAKSSPAAPSIHQSDLLPRPMANSIPAAGGVRQ